MRFVSSLLWQLYSWSVRRLPRQPEHEGTFTNGKGTFTWRASLPFYEAKGPARFA